MLLFLAKFTLAAAVFAALYAALLRRETFHRANRLYLAGTLWLALGYALWPDNAVAPPEPLAPDSALVSYAAEPAPPAALTIALAAVERRLLFGEPGRWLRLLWLGGVLLAVVRLCWGLARLYALIPGTPFDRLSDGSVLVRTEAIRTPFSFFRWIFVPGSFDLAGRDTEAVLAHERAHAEHGHSMDVIFAEALCIALWFHPLAHWYRRALALVHEYQADADTARRLGRRAYGEVLVRQAAGTVDGFGITSALLHGSLKRRIAMLVRPAASPRRAWRYAAVLPLLGLLAAPTWQSLACLRDDAGAFDGLPLAQLEAYGLRSAAPSGAEMAPVSLTGSGGALFDPGPGRDELGRWFYRSVEQMPVFPGDWPAFVGAQRRTLDVRMPAIVFARFVVERDGSITGVRALTPGDYHFAGYERLQRDTEKWLARMPHWQPAVHRGDTVRCEVVVRLEYGF